jgi:hypothetical protein
MRFGAFKSGKVCRRTILVLATHHLLVEYICDGMVATLLTWAWWWWELIAAHPHQLRFSSTFMYGSICFRPAQDNFGWLPFIPMECRDVLPGGHVVVVVVLLLWGVVCHESCGSPPAVPPSVGVLVDCSFGDDVHSLVSKSHHWRQPITSRACSIVHRQRVDLPRTIDGGPDGLIRFGVFAY